MAQPGRQYHSQQVHYLRRTVTYADTSGTQFEIGAIPAGSVVIGTTVCVTTAFNAGTTNVLIVGTSGDDDALVDASGVTEGSIGVARVAPATLGGLLSASASTVIYSKYTQSGTAATAGSAEVIVEYIPDNDR